SQTTRMMNGLTTINIRSSRRRRNSAWPISSAGSRTIFVRLTSTSSHLGGSFRLPYSGADLSGNAYDEFVIVGIGLQLVELTRALERYRNIGQRAAWRAAHHHHAIT